MVLKERATLLILIINFNKEFYLIHILSENDMNNHEKRRTTTTIPMMLTIILVLYGPNIALTMGEEKIQLRKSTNNI